MSSRHGVVGGPIARTQQRSRELQQLRTFVALSSHIATHFLIRASDSLSRLPRSASFSWL